MIPAWILLLLNQFFFTLRLSGGGNGSFPRPLKAEEERQCLELAAQGDLEARNKLIEHNLRLVAHIVKKGYCKGPICPALFIRSGTCYDPYRFKKRQKRRRQHAV